MNDVDRLLADYGRNLPAFEEQEELLEQEHLGKFALFCGGELTGVYETAEEADVEGGACGEYAVFKIGRQPLRYALPRDGTLCADMDRPALIPLLVQN